jgi:hypothetical protein
MPLKYLNSPIWWFQCVFRQSTTHTQDKKKEKKRKVYLTGNQKCLTGETQRQDSGKIEDKRHDITRHDTTRQGKARHGKAKQDKTTQDTTGRDREFE